MPTTIKMIYKHRLITDDGYFSLLLGRRKIFHIMIRSCDYIIFTFCFISSCCNNIFRIPEKLDKIKCFFLKLRPFKQKREEVAFCLCISSDNISIPFSSSHQSDNWYASFLPGVWKNLLIFWNTGTTLLCYILCLNCSSSGNYRECHNSR